jgi:hypothetical protein
MVAGIHMCSYLRSADAQLIQDEIRATMHGTVQTCAATLPASIPYTCPSL